MGPRVLIIEDNEADVFLIRRALLENSIDATVTVCADGEAAVGLLSAADAGTVPHVIIIDLDLPRIAGLDVLQTILHRPLFVGTPIMVFTSSPSPADKHRIELLAGARYVQKPSGIDRFLSTVAENVKAMLAQPRGANAGPGIA